MDGQGAANQAAFRANLARIAAREAAAEQEDREEAHAEAAAEGEQEDIPETPPAWDEPLSDDEAAMADVISEVGERLRRFEEAVHAGALPVDDVPLYIPDMPPGDEPLLDYEAYENPEAEADAVAEAAAGQEDIPPSDDDDDEDEAMSVVHHVTALDDDNATDEPGMAFSDPDPHGIMTEAIRAVAVDHPYPVDGTDRSLLLRATRHASDVIEWIEEKWTRNNKEFDEWRHREGPDGIFRPDTTQEVLDAHAAGRFVNDRILALSVWNARVSQNDPTELNVFARCLELYAPDVYLKFKDAWTGSDSFTLPMYRDEYVGQGRLVLAYTLGSAKSSYAESRDMSVLVEAIKAALISAGMRYDTTTWMFDQRPDPVQLRFVMDWFTTKQLTDIWQRLTQALKHARMAMVNGYRELVAEELDLRRSTLYMQQVGLLHGVPITTESGRVMHLPPGVGEHIARFLEPPSAPDRVRINRPQHAPTATFNFFSERHVGPELSKEWATDDSTKWIDVVEERLSLRPGDYDAVWRLKDAYTKKPLVLGIDIPLDEPIRKRFGQLGRVRVEIKVYGGPLKRTIEYEKIGYAIACHRGEFVEPPRDQSHEQKEQEQKEQPPRRLQWPLWKSDDRDLINLEELGIAEGEREPDYEETDDEAYDPVTDNSIHNLVAVRSLDGKHVRVCNIYTYLQDLTTSGTPPINPDAPHAFKYRPPLVRELNFRILVDPTDTRAKLVKLLRERAEVNTRYADTSILLPILDFSCQKAKIHSVPNEVDARGRPFVYRDDNDHPHKFYQADVNRSYGVAFRSTFADLRSRAMQWSGTGQSPAADINAVFYHASTQVDKIASQVGLGYGIGSKLEEVITQSFRSNEFDPQEQKVLRRRITDYYHLRMPRANQGLARTSSTASAAAGAAGSRTPVVFMNPSLARDLLAAAFYADPSAVPRIWKLSVPIHIQTQVSFLAVLSRVEAICEQYNVLDPRRADETLFEYDERQDATLEKRNALIAYVLGPPATRTRGRMATPSTTTMSRTQGKRKRAEGASAAAAAAPEEDSSSDDSDEEQDPKRRRTVFKPADDMTYDDFYSIYNEGFRDEGEEGDPDDPPVMLNDLIELCTLQALYQLTIDEIPPSGRSLWEEVEHDATQFCRRAFKRLENDTRKAIHDIITPIAREYGNFLGFVEENYEPPARFAIGDRPAYVYAGDGESADAAWTVVQFAELNFASTLDEQLGDDLRDVVEDVFVNTRGGLMHRFLFALYIAVHYPELAAARNSDHLRFGTRTTAEDERRMRATQRAPAPNEPPFDMNYQSSLDLSIAIFARSEGRPIKLTINLTEDHTILPPRADDSDAAEDEPPWLAAAFASNPFDRDAAFAYDFPDSWSDARQIEWERVRRMQWDYCMERLEFQDLLHFISGGPNVFDDSFKQRLQVRFYQELKRRERALRTTGVGLSSGQYERDPYSGRVASVAWRHRLAQWQHRQAEAAAADLEARAFADSVLSSFTAGKRHRGASAAAAAATDNASSSGSDSDGEERKEPKRTRRPGEKPAAEMTLRDFAAIFFDGFVASHDDPPTYVNAALHLGTLQFCMGKAQAAREHAPALVKWEDVERAATAFCRLAHRETLDLIDQITTEQLAPALRPLPEFHAWVRAEIAYAEELESGYPNSWHEFPPRRHVADGTSADALWTLRQFYFRDAYRDEYEPLLSDAQEHMVQDFTAEYGTDTNLHRVLFAYFVHACYPAHYAVRSTDEFRLGHARDLENPAAVAAFEAVQKRRDTAHVPSAFNYQSSLVLSAYVFGHPAGSSQDDLFQIMDESQFALLLGVGLFEEFPADWTAAQQAEWLRAHTMQWSYVTARLTDREVELLSRFDWDEDGENSQKLARRFALEKQRRIDAHNYTVVAGQLGERRRLYPHMLQSIGAMLEGMPASVARPIHTSNASRAAYAAVAATGAAASSSHTAGRARRRINHRA